MVAIPDHVTITEGPLVTLTCKATVIRYGRRTQCGAHTYGTLAAAERDAVRVHTHASDGARDET